MRHMTEYAPTKTSEYPSGIPQFWKENKQNSLRLCEHMLECLS